jgi:hypothetical protein
MLPRTRGGWQMWMSCLEMALAFSPSDSQSFRTIQTVDTFMVQRTKLAPQQYP